MEVIPSGGSKFGEPMHSLIIRPSIDDLLARDANTYLPLNTMFKIMKFLMQGPSVGAVGAAAPTDFNED